ncbi:MAG TPA: hypothetical protein VMU34_26290 [Mycobacterium sp.]|nr:hypothetical protein [Mycobacterium sp.]
MPGDVGREDTVSSSRGENQGPAGEPRCVGTCAIGFGSDDRVAGCPPVLEIIRRLVPGGQPISPKILAGGPDAVGRHADACGTYFAVCSGVTK